MDLLRIRCFPFFICCYFFLSMNVVRSESLFFYEPILGFNNLWLGSISSLNQKIALKYNLKFIEINQFSPYLNYSSINRSFIYSKKKDHLDVALSYEVIIKAPYKLSKLLKTNLEIIRYANNNQLVSTKQLNYLLVTTEKRAQDLLQTEGYFSAKISIYDKSFDWKKEKYNLLKSQSKKRTIVISVEPGKQAKVAHVVLTFDGDINSEAQKRIHVIRKIFSLKVGDTFSQAKWDAAKTDALLELQAERYLSAYINFSEVLVNKEKAQVNLRVDFCSGPTFYLGPITFSGMRRYPEFIASYINPLREGEVYSRSRINELQRKVQNTSYYSGVGIEVQDAISYARRAPVTASLREFPFYSMRNGIGYSTDRGPHLQGSFSFNNLFGKSWVLSTQGRYEKKNRFGSMAFIMPPDCDGYINSALASYNTTYLANKPMTSMRLGFSRERSLQFYEYTYSLLFYKDLWTQQSLLKQNSFALMPNFRLAYRNVDDLIYPSNGYLFNVEFGFALKNFFSKADFFRIHSQGKRYFPFSERSIFLIRGEMGAIVSSASSSSIPISLRFRTGGALSVRGYQFEGIGIPVTGGIIPTKYILNTSSEYQYWFSKNWGMAFFLDIGVATNSIKKALSYPGYGFGVRWNSPVGPVNIDLGFGLFSNLPRLHFALGVAL